MSITQFCIDCGGWLLGYPLYRCKCDPCLQKQAKEIRDRLDQYYQSRAEEIDLALEWELPYVGVKWHGTIVRLREDRMAVIVDIDGVGEREMSFQDVAIHIPAPG